LSFAPTQNYQQAGLLAYQDDDNYVQITREYNGGNKVALVREAGGSAAVLQAPDLTATNLYLRLDRDAATETISGYYSLNGTNWTAMGGGVVQPLNNPRLAVFVGASPGGFPNADLAWAEVIAPHILPVLALSPATLAFWVVAGDNPAGQALGITNSGGGILNWSAVATGSTPAWLAVSPASGAGNGMANVAVTSAGLAPGNYSKTITVNGVGAINSPRIVTVNLTVTNVPVPMITSVDVTDAVAVIAWTATAGRNYKLQCKAEPTDPDWTDFSPVILATSPTATYTNVVGDLTRRFYRILLVP
jgi:hypothetical protein